MESPLLEFRDVSMTFNEVEVFRTLSMTVMTPGVTAILGSSGSGKTTLLRLAGGLIKPSSGSVIFRGLPITGPDPSRVLIFQQYALFPWATARRNLMFGPALAKNRKHDDPKMQDGKRIRQKADNLLSRLGLLLFADHYPKTLSGGMQQRIAVARSLILSPDLLLLDEPFGALDSVTKLSVYKLLRSELSGTDRSAVLVTHDIDDALALAHTIFVLPGRPVHTARRFEVNLSDMTVTDRERKRAKLRDALIRAFKD